MTTTTPTHIIIYGFGNTMAGDDGAGVHVARRLLAAELPAGVRVVEIGAPGPELIDPLADAQAEIWFVDAAVKPGEPPGAILRETLDPDQPAPLEMAGRLVTTHGFGMAELIKLADALGRRRARVRLWGVVGECFQPGDTLTPAVAKAAAELAEVMIKSLNESGPERTSEGLSEH